MSRQQTFTANQPITGSVNGYTLTLYGLQITLQWLNIDKGSIDIDFDDPSQPATVAVPANIVPCVKFKAGVSNYGVAGPAVNQVSVFMAWDDIVLRGSGISYITLNNLFDRVPHMYGFGLNAIKKLDITELRELAMNQSLPEIVPPRGSRMARQNTLWRPAPNYCKAVSSLAPNPLNKKQMVIDEKLPQTFTVLALEAFNGNYYLAFKMQLQNDRLSAFVDFYSWTTFPEGKTELLKRYDVTAQLPDSLPYFYFVYWLNLYAIGNENELHHVNFSLPDEYNCTIFENDTHSPNMVFNVGIGQEDTNNILTPLFCRFGILPAAKAPATDFG